MEQSNNAGILDATRNNNDKPTNLTQASVSHRNQADFSGNRSAGIHSDSMSLDIADIADIGTHLTQHETSMLDKMQSKGQKGLRFKNKDFEYQFSHYWELRYGLGMKTSLFMIFMILYILEVETNKDASASCSPSSPSSSSMTSNSTNEPTVASSPTTSPTTSPVTFVPS